MDINASGDGGFDVDWTTDDELEIGSEPGPLALTDAIAGSRDVNIQASTSGGDSGLKLINHFVGMGFSEKLVVKAIEETGEGDAESILNTILTYSTLEDSPEQQLSQHSDPSSLDYNEVLPEDLSDMESWSEDEIEEKPMSDKHKELLALASIGSLSEKDQKLLDLLNMGYSAEEALIAIDRSAPGASVADLIDCIFSAQIAREESCYLPDDDLKPRHLYSGSSSCNNKKRKHIDMRRNNVIEDAIRFPNPMIGFGVPSEQPARVHRTLPERARGRPYFYYENVALTPKGVWDQISRFLYDIEPEFVDSKFFCAAARKRGYVHNLPIENRFPLVPLPPLTVQQAFPLSRRWWPVWDPRDKLNCLQTVTACAKLTEKLRGYLERYDGEPPEFIQKRVLYECRKWNLVWVGRNKLAPLEPDEVEMLLGFPKNHTRGGGISRTDRFKSLGNSFQVDTVAYHLSVLKDMFPNGINVLSLFSGIGGAEVALHRLGIKLKNVVCVEISKVNRDIVRSWWEQTNQTGNLYDYEDVELMDGDRLDQIMDMIGGGFDLIIGGSPCNNLAGSNRRTRDGLEGAESRLFFDYFRILDLVKNLMQDRQL